MKKKYFLILVLSIVILLFFIKQKETKFHYISKLDHTEIIYGKRVVSRSILVESPPKDSAEFRKIVLKKYSSIKLPNSWSSLTIGFFYMDEEGLNVENPSEKNVLCRLDFCFGKNGIQKTIKLFDKVGHFYNNETWLFEF